MLCAVTHGDDGLKSTDCITDAVKEIEIQVGQIRQVALIPKEIVMVVVLLLVILIIVLV
jgi:hypothetical protein